MKVGERTIRGTIKTREAARRVYEEARAAGHVASLLEQERPNIFTQSVANIMPGEGVKITIRYVETLKYEDGWFNFVFPTVVGPRYIPGSPTSAQPPQQPGTVQPATPQGSEKPTGTGWAPDTTQVPDASRITPPVTAEGTRAGHDISIQVAIDAGQPLRKVESVLHEVETSTEGDTTLVRLKDKAVIPNKDFILRYTTAGEQVGDAILTHASAQGRFVTLILQPPARVKPEQVTPKEMVFVMDTSGSMSGAPIEKSKQTMLHCIANLNDKDTFNVITFSGDTRILFPQPVPATDENRRKATAFLASREASGGTEMMKAIKAALDPSDAADHLRIVVFMTDGYVGNDMAIIDEIQRHPNARIFSFGIGQSVNRFLLDNMAKAGRGTVDYVPLNAEGTQVADRFYERLRNPVLTDITVDWGGLPVQDVYPERIPDLFSAQPVVVYGRYTGSGRGEVVLRGSTAQGSFQRAIKVELPPEQDDHEVLAPLWARARVEYLMNQDWLGMQTGKPRTDLKDAITDLGLRYRLVTQYTSFVAVEEMIVTEGGQPRTIAVPVEMPEGVSYEGVFGTQAEMAMGGAMRGPAGAAGAAGPAGPAVPAVVLAAPAPAPSGTFRGNATPDEPGTYNLTDRITAIEKSNASPEDKRKALLQLKLAPELQGLAAKVGESGNFTDGVVAVHDGQIEVAVWLFDDSDANIAKLKELGFTVILKPQSAKLAIGKADVKKLEELALLEFVKRVDLPPM
jgi:Ca-activated chloride channel family protein